jgi:hypothetical protein
MARAQSHALLLVPVPADSVSKTYPERFIAIRMAPWWVLVLTIADVLKGISAIILTHV